MTRNNPLALVTGGSAGIGYELAAQCARNGYDVIITGAADRVYDSAARLGAATGAQVTAMQADLRTEEGVAAVWQAVVDDGRPLQIAMLNAGISIGGAGFLDTDLEAELGEIALNVTSQVRLAKPVTTHMVANHSGRILFTSSLSAWGPTPFETVYGPTRAFIYMFALGLRQELQEHGVVVTVLLPGATATEFHGRAGMQNTAYGPNDGKNDPAMVARIGYEGLMAGLDHVIGDTNPDESETRRWSVPDHVKAAEHDKNARPR